MAKKGVDASIWRESLLVHVRAFIRMTMYVYAKEAKTEPSSICAIKFVFLKLTS